MSSEERIRPESVAPADAAALLAAVNGAQSARALADAIELPDEPDVGLRIAASILERRAALGGAFTDVAQLLTVPEIGPVRFTRIVRALLRDVHGLIRPEDVSEADGARVLGVLNAALSAQALADDIELPDEPDIGLHLGARILERRAELGGAFTSLAQLFTVPLIGPVRFTRIVRSILGTGVTRDEFDNLAAQVKALQDALAAAPPRVVISAVEPQRYLGEPVNLVARVTSAGGLPIGGVPVTLSASWGRLRGSDGFSVQEGGNVTLRTAGDGAVRVALVPPTSEDLEEVQQQAIEAQLVVLAPGAAAPHAAAGALETLVRAYQFEANDDFRAGVDIYFRDFHQHLLDSVNYRDELAAWPTFDSAIVAYAHELTEDGATDTGVLASGAVVVHVRDWLGAWLQTHVDLASAETLLGGELQVATGFADPSDLVARIHQRVGEYVSVQQGVVGVVVAQKVAEAKLGSFLEADIDVLPEASRQSVFPAVSTAATTVRTLGTQALGAFEQTRADLRAHVDTQLSSGLGPALEQAAPFTALRAAVAAKVDQSTFTSALASKVDLTTLNQHLQDAADFSSFRSSLITVIGTLIPPGGFEIGP